MVVALVEIVDIRLDSCKVDGKKVIRDRDGFYCERCNGITKAVVPRLVVLCI